MAAMTDKVLFVVFLMFDRGSSIMIFLLSD